MQNSTNQNYAVLSSTVFKLVCYVFFIAISMVGTTELVAKQVEVSPFMHILIALGISTLISIITSVTMPNICDLSIIKWHKTSIPVDCKHPTNGMVTTMGMVSLLLLTIAIGTETIGTVMSANKIAEYITPIKENIDATNHNKMASESVINRKMAEKTAGLRKKDHEKSIDKKYYTKLKIAEKNERSFSAQGNKKEESLWRIKAKEIRRTIESEKSDFSDNKLTKLYEKQDSIDSHIATLRIIKERESLISHSNKIAQLTEMSWAKKWFTLILYVLMVVLIAASYYISSYLKYTENKDDGQNPFYFIFTKTWHYISMAYCYIMPEYVGEKKRNKVLRSAIADADLALLTSKEGIKVAEVLTIKMKELAFYREMAIKNVSPQKARQVFMVMLKYGFAESINDQWGIVKDADNTEDPVNFHQGYQQY